MQIDQSCDEVGQAGTEEDEVHNTKVHIQLNKGAHLPDQTGIVLDYWDGGKDDDHDQEALKWIEQVEHGHTDPIQGVELELVPHRRVDVIHISDQLGQAPSHDEAHHPFMRWIEVYHSKDDAVCLQLVDQQEPRKGLQAEQMREYLNEHGQF